MRAAVSDIQRNRLAVNAAELFTQSVLFQSHQHFACYFARTEEFDCIPIIQAIWNANKKTYLPILEGNGNNSLKFAAYQADTPLQLNRYRILEPVEPIVFPTQQLDVVLLPLVAFDRQGNRLGMGGGYYDRTFEFLLTEPARKPILIGLAYEFQCVKQLPQDSWDVPLSAILTEKQIIII